MQKYRHVFSIGIQNNLTYRFNYLTRTLFSFIPLFAMLSLWRTVYAHNGKPSAGFTEAEIVFYYILVAVVDVMTAVNEDDWQIASDIREGNISQFLLKPIDYLWYRVCLFFAGRAAYISMASIPLAIFILCFKSYFVMPASGAAMVLFPVSLFLTALLQFFISYTMAMLAFWFLEISTFIFILFAFEYIASGHLFPLTMLPAPLFHALMFTPFPSMLYVPISIYMGKLTGWEAALSMLMQLGWVVAAYFLARFMWNRGIKKYSAFGG
ncbi:MAG TPA: ABC-2 family transporter protein [Desulfuromonadaceae bacterium]|nr:ABC-2 family transporter protein [Desulfuromonadaceae bacterium]